MNCDETRALFDDYAAGALPDAAHRSIETHLRHCSRCRHVAADEHRLRAALRALPAPPMPPGFAQRALRNARQRNRRQWARSQYRWFGAGFATALFAAVIGWSALTAYVPEQPVSAHVSMAVNQVRTVGLVIDAPDDLAGVEVSMVVPDNVELVGFPGRRHLSWKTDLGKGRNVLSLPILATGQGNDELRVSLFHERKSKNFRFLLGVADGGQSRTPGAPGMPG